MKKFHIISAAILTTRCALTTVLVVLMMLTVQTAFAAENGWDIQASTSGNVTTFTISRTNTAVAETVKYRLVNLSAYAGQHYYVSQVNGEDKTTVAAQTAALSGEFTFAAGETESRTIQVTESAANTNAYKYQTGTKRSYKLEMTDAGGFYLTSNTRSFTTGTQFSATKVSKSITNLVYFNSSGNYTSDVSSSKYLDVSYTPASSNVETSGTLNGYVLIDDSYDYANKPATVSTSTLINSTGANATYLYNLGYKIYATVCFTEKEKDDGYQYVQILAGTSSSSYDTGYDLNGSVNTPVNSVYKACFELSDGSNAEGKQYFPHRYSYANKTAESSASIGITEFSQTNGKLWQQAFKSSSYQASTSGSLIFDANVSNITTRFDAGGDNDDTWGYKDFFVRMALVDGSAPTVISNSITVAPGYHAKGNTVYVSVAFNEIVQVTGTPTLTTTSGNNWGLLSYVAGDGTNVLTFSTTIPANATGNLNITGLSGTVKDLAGNSLNGSSVTATNLCSVDESYTYTISYNLNEGTVATENPTTYTWETATFTLNNPTKTGYVFNGWTGSNGSTASTSVTIANHSHGNKSYTANWTNVWGVSADVDGSTAEKAYTISTTQGLDLLAQCVNSGNHFSSTYFQLGDDITYSHTTDWNDASSEENNFTAIGTLNKPFYGTFDGNNYTVSGIRIYNPDGNCQGLFGCIMVSSTVRRVCLADSRITAKNNVGGIVGYNGTSCTVEDCAVAADVCIHAKVTDADNHGGITGYNAFYSKVQRCISRATLTVADVTDCDYYGGIAGYLSIASDKSCSTIRYCLVIGATIPDVGKRGAIAGKMPTKQGYTQYNYYRSCTVAGVVNATGVGSGEHGNDGISTDVGQNYGAQPLYAVTLPANASLVRTPATDAPLPGTNNTIYFTGADIEGVPYAYATAKLNLSYNIAALTTGYTVAVSAVETTGGTAVALTDNGNYTYDFTMPAADVTVTATPTNVWGVSADIDGSTVDKAYTITTTDGLDLLATLVNNGDGFSGKFFKLGNDITYDHTTAWNDASSEENNYTAIGGYYNGGWKNFCGTFNGQGHTVSGIRIYKGGDDRDADAYQGLFGRTWDAIIKNVNLSDARITGYVYVGGIAGILSGTMENCRVVSDVTIHAVANGTNKHGGVVGYFNIGTIRGCVSTATLTVASGLTGNYEYGGIAGSLGNNSNMSDCLALGATVPAVYADYGAIAGDVDDNWTYANNYHHDCTVGGNAAPSDTYNVSAYTISAGTDVTVAPAGTAAQTYDYNGIQRYGNALYYGGVLYAPADADVSLTLGYSSVPTGLTVEYTPTAGTLSGTENPYTLTMPNEDVTINGALSVNYIAADGSKQTCYNPTVIQSGTTAYGSSANDEKWYVVLPGEVTINGYLNIYDQSAHLILCDGATLTVTCNSYSAINCSHSITIYGQSGGTGTLNATTTQSSQNGIRTDGNLTINGGIVNATSKDYQGIWADGGNVTINGGTVNATAGAGSFSYGIEAYKSSNVGGNVTINGGTVNATGSSYGIYANGTITLGWTNPTDRITASRYSTYPKVKTGQTLTDGSAAYSGSVNTSDIDGKTLWPDLWDVAGGNDGSTAAKAYTITTTGGLDQLAAQVNNGSFKNFEGKFFRLGDDITYSHKADNEEGADTENNYTAISGHINGNWRHFCGTFDGQGHTVSGIRIYKGGTDYADNYQGLFGYTLGATIKNVILTDARITGYNEVGGIAGYITENNSLGGIVENCRVGSDVTIHAVANGAFAHGGVVGECNGGTIRGCVSAATLTVADGLTVGCYGGIVGDLNGNMSDCLAIGATVPAVNDDYGAIAGDVDDNWTYANNYHHDCTVGDNTHQSNVYTISAGTDVTVAPAADVSPAQTYDYNGIKRYGYSNGGNDLYYGGVLYTIDAGANFSLTLGYTANAELYRGFTASAGTLSGTENPYTLTMPAEDVTIDGRLKKAITITTKNKGRIYDGYPLTTSADPVTALNGDGWNITSPTSPVLEDGDQITLTFPSLTEVGSIENRPTVVIRNSNNEDVTANYNITFTCGTLTVRYYQVTLFDNSQDGENIRAIERALGLPKVNVQLQSRILYKDGDWNTLCVPFSLSAEQIAESPLAGADIRTLSDASLAGGVLTLNFTPAAPAEGAVTSMEAGVPYLIKWTEPDPYIPYDYTNEDDCSDIYQPIFQGVTLSQDMYPVRCDFTNLGSDYYMEFMGTYNTIFWHGERDILFLGANNTLYYPNVDNLSQIDAFRAYFQFSWRLTNADVRAFNLNFGEEAQGIGSLNSLTPDPSLGGEGSIYSLDGRKLDGKPTKKGLYIVNGNKVVIK